MPKKPGGSSKKASGRDLPDRRQRVQSAEIGMGVLKALADIGGSASLTSLSERLGESPAKVHRYLASMVEQDFVFQDAQSGRYVLGAAAISVGIAALHQSNPLAYATAELKTLATRHNLAAFSSILGNRGPVVMEFEAISQPVALSVQVGTVLPVLWSATGRIFGAHIASERIEPLIQRDLREPHPDRERFMKDRKAIRALFNEVRSHGCTLVRDSFLPGITAIAAPVFDATSQIAAAITAIGFSANLELDPNGQAAVLVKQAAANVSNRLGYHGEESQKWFPGII